MGLDITAYRDCTKIECSFNKEGEPINPRTGEPFEWDEYAQPYHNTHYAQRADTVEDKGIYIPKDKTGFRAGSYSGYNRWRDWLAKLTGFKSDEDAWSKDSGPFWELISFSDCEGVIGPETSKKLATDFQDFQDKADAESSDDCKELYAEWRKAFEFAADNGFVTFH